MKLVFSQRKEIAERAIEYLRKYGDADLCDPTNIVTALQSLGYIKEPGDATLTCVYCGTAYPYLTLSEALIEVIKDLAEQENRTLADMCRALIREAIKRRSK